MPKKGILGTPEVEKSNVANKKTLFEEKKGARFFSTFIVGPHVGRQEWRGPADSEIKGAPFSDQSWFPKWLPKGVAPYQLSWDGILAIFFFWATFVKKFRELRTKVLERCLGVRGKCCRPKKVDFRSITWHFAWCNPTF